MRILLSLLLISIALACASTSQAETRILFSSDKEDINERWDLYSMRPDGSDLQRITQTTDRSEWAAALAPDGQRIAYIDNRGGTSNIWLTDLDGAAAVNVPTTNRAMAVQWADEDTLYYFADISGGKLQRFQIWQVNLDGSGQAAVYSAVWDIFPTGSDSFQFHQPSGRLYFTARIPINNPSIPYSGLPADSTFDTTYTRCTDPTFQAGMLDDHYDLARSPDSSKIAYAADFFDGNHRMYVRDADGDCDSQIRVSTGFTGDPHWSPDSQWIAFTRATNSSFGSGPYIGDIYTVGANGVGLTSRTASVTRVSNRCAHPLVYTIAPAPFHIKRMDLTSRGLRIFWDGIAGTEYTIEFSNDLKEWEPLPGSVFTPDVDEEVAAGVAGVSGNQRRYYRIVARCL